MGAVTFSLDSQMVKLFKGELPLTTFVEVNSFNADTIDSMLPFFDRLISIGLPNQLFLNASNRFSRDKRVKLLQGNSADLLVDISTSLTSQSTLYWLDTELCDVDKEFDDSISHSFLDKIQRIGTLNQQSLILINWSKCSLTSNSASNNDNNSPTIEQLLEVLHSLGQCHELAIIDNIIAFYPISARSAIDNYVKFYGIKLLRVSPSLVDNKILLKDIALKEIAIQELHVQLRAKEQVIHNLRRSINHFKYLPIIRWAVRLTGIFVPRLGNLNQYGPRPLSILDTYKLEKNDCPLKISIVTPSYSQGAFIEKTLLSVLEQGYPNLEYFVQDGGSTDGTVAVLKQYETKLSGWVSEPDSGQSQAINRGFSSTNGDIMAWLNSDDILLPGALACVADYFNSHPEVDVVYGDRLMIDQNNMEIGRWMLPDHNNKVLSWVDFVPQETMFWRRSIWDKVGGHIDESYRFAMDWDLLVRFREAGARFAHISRFLGAFRIHDSQKTTSIINEIGHKEMERIRERQLGRVPSQKDIRKAVLPYVCRHIAVDMAYRIRKKLEK